jgi:outer membrane protein TolC
MGCAHYQRYEPTPLDPQAQLGAYAGRRLDDPELARFLASRGVPPDDSGLTPSALGLAALYFRSNLTEARAAVRAARAGEITAGTRPFPSATATVERATSSDGRNGSPWTLSLTSGLTFETGGKREARQVRARAVTLGTVLRLDVTGWHLAQEARRAAVALLGADRDVADVEAEISALRTVLELLRARYAEGRVSLADVAQAETDVQTAVVALVQVRRARTDMRSSLARALGVSPRPVETMSIREDLRSGCDAGDAANVEGPTGLGLAALRNRYEVGAALADYAVAEADLQLAVAQQYPNLTIGPGVAWNQGVGRWLLSAGSAAIPVNGNRGPIAEGEARRAVHAARVTMAEDGILAQVDSARAGCRDIRGEIAAADSLVAATTERLRLTEAAYARGEIGLTDVAFARLALVRVTRTRHQALQRQQVAGAALEAAIGRWVTAPSIRWPDLFESLSTPDDLEERRE